MRAGAKARDIGPGIAAAVETGHGTKAGTKADQARNTGGGVAGVAAAAVREAAKVPAGKTGTAGGRGGSEAKTMTVRSAASAETRAGHPRHRQGPALNAAGSVTSGTGRAQAPAASPCLLCLRQQLGQRTWVRAVLQVGGCSPREGPRGT